jgi:hypothetical protein
MTIAVDQPGCRSVFDAGLHAVDCEHAQSPDEAHAIIREARHEAPIALRPHGLEVLTYDLVHTVQSDPRFRVPQGMFLASQSASGSFTTRFVDTK